MCLIAFKSYLSSCNKCLLLQTMLLWSAPCNVSVAATASLKWSFGATYQTFADGTSERKIWQCAERRCANSRVFIWGQAEGIMERIPQKWRTHMGEPRVQVWQEKAKGVRVRVTLRLTAGQSVCLGVEPTLWTFDQILLPFQVFGFTCTE
jgi:hypothetical protein